MALFVSFLSLSHSIRGEYELTDALQTISDKIKIVRHTGFWKDIGSPLDLITANETYMENMIKNIQR